MTPKICIVFNGGASGDFFTMLINEQINNSMISIDKIGMVTNCPGDFKVICKKYYECHDLQVFKNINWSSVVNTHHCNKDVIEMFPSCRFYFIDDSEYHHVTIEALIKKRLELKYDTLVEYFISENDIFKKHNKLKLIKLNEEDVKRLMIKDWKRNIKGWQRLGIPKVNIQDIVNKEKCRHTIENIINCKVDYNKFSSTHDQYVSKNIDMIERING